MGGIVNNLDLIHWPGSLEINKGYSTFVYGIIKSSENLDICRGADDTYFLLNEILISPYVKDDQLYNSDSGEIKIVKRYEKEFFPNVDRNTNRVERYLSIPLIGSFLLGSSEVSYYNIYQKRFWTCTKEDFKLHGKNFISHIETIYPNKLDILTFISKNT